MNQNEGSYDVLIPSAYPQVVAQNDFYQSSYRIHYDFFYMEIDIQKRS